MIAKLRPTVIILAAMAAGCAMGGLAMFFAHLDTIQAAFKGSEEILSILIIAGISATVGALVGSLLTLAGQVATDPPPPAYPAKELPDLVKVLRDSDGND